MADLNPSTSGINNASGGSEGAGFAGVTIQGGALVYRDEDDENKIKVADNTDIATAEVVGISLQRNTRSGHPIVFQTTGEVDIGAAVVDGETYVLGDTGNIHPASDLLATEFMTVVGVGLAPESLLLAINPSGFQLATAGSTGDVAITHPGVLKVSGDSAGGIVGADVDSGEVVYLDVSDGRFKRAANTSLATAQAEGHSLVNLLSVLQPITYLTAGELDISGTLVIGELYVLSISGLISPVGDVASPDFVTHIGVAKTTSNIIVRRFASGRQRAA